MDGLRKLIYMVQLLGWRGCMDLVLGVIAKTEEGRNTLLRSDFPNNVENKFCNNLLESWDMFIDYQ